MLIFTILLRENHAQKLSYYSNVATMYVWKTLEGHLEKLFKSLCTPRSYSSRTWITWSDTGEVIQVPLYTKSSSVYTTSPLCTPKVMQPPLYVLSTRHLNSSKKFSFELKNKQTWTSIKFLKQKCQVSF